MVKDGAKIKEAIQVCHTISEDNKEREAEGLLEAMEKFGLSKGIILTKEQDALIKIKGKGIRVLPVWKWLLGYE